MISVTVETVIVRLTEAHLASAREAYGLPESFGVGDGIVIVEAEG